MGDVQLPDADAARDAREKAFTRRVALMTGVYAVVLAIGSMGGNNAMKDMLSASTEAANQWSFYQAKAQREHLYRLEAERLEAELLVRASVAPEARAKLETLRKDHLARADRYKRDRVAIKKEAERQIVTRNSGATKDPFFDYAGVLLQIAIVLASICMVSESHIVFWFSLVAALGGTGLTIAGFVVG